MRHYLTKIPGQVYLWVAVPILAASSSVLRKVTEIGAQQFMNGHNPVSFCNVLFAGNLCAIVGMLIFHRHQFSRKDFRRITRSEWKYLTISAVLSGAIIPAIIFQALSLAPVNNIILLARIELPLALITSTVILKEQFNRRQIVGAIIVSIGILIALMGNGSMSQTSSFRLGNGEILTIISSGLITLSSLTNKKYLSHISLGVIHIFRLGVGTIIFFIVANVLFGPGHFGELFSPFLWKWMLVYGGIIIVIGQSFWAKGFRATPVSVSAIVSCLNPIAGMFFAYWILAEVPTSGQLLGGGVLLIGLLLSSIAGRDRGIHRDD